VTGHFELHKKGKRIEANVIGAAAEQVDRSKNLQVFTMAVSTLKEVSADQSLIRRLTVSFRLGVDPKQSDQMCGTAPFRME